jgi:hypothetical protein
MKTYVGNDPVDRTDPSGLAYFSMRRLDTVKIWIPPLSGGGPLHWMKIAVNHEAVFFEDGVPPPNVGYDNNMGVYTDYNPGRVRWHDSPGHYNDCIMHEAVKDPSLQWPAVDYRLIGHNCQDWAAAVKRVYHQLENDPAVKKKCCGKP